ncbi:unnamed protein product [Brachionus calyciflorus]|uniref:Phosphatidylinositol-3-phosphatase SAC1 n=1 Tax=Brachionus calyciflorus TaxID=104777 RepID=A0A813Q424_9BILA|nr:unnamed protein product [Brachionus calyciflorus]
MTSTYSNFNLHTSDEYLYIQSYSANEVITIDRLTNEITIRDQNSIPSSAAKKPIHALVGAIQLIAGNYLIVVTSKSKVGVLDEHEIWKCEKFEILPFHRNDNHLNEDEKKINSSYKSMVEYFLTTQNFYFSYTYDLTYSLQKLQETSPEFLALPLFERADKRFMWNYHLIQTMNPTKEMSNFILPFILGFISLNRVQISGRSFEFGLISRRSTYFAGTRFNVRGSDEEGNVANFVETEQILNYQEYKCSYVQVRGSIPLFWSQKVNLKYKPPILIDETSSQIEACKRHFSKMLSTYNQHVCINLINQHGSEGRLEKSYSEALKMLNEPQIRYEYFDFHKQCGKNQWDRLNILINRLANDQDFFGYFCINKNGSILSNQRGIFRTNCIDCLDRTNVVQGLLAKRMLHIQLIKLGLLSETEAIEYHEEFNNIFRNVWADNGDFLSIQYAGTGALKSDFTRTGKRTTYGLLRDGFNSLYRYLLNNFNDGFRQDSIDLVLGNYRVSPNEGLELEKCPVANENKKYLALPIIAIGTFSMFIISLLIPAETFQEQFMYILFWGMSTLLTLAAMLYLGPEIVDAPKLVHKPKNKKE